METTENKIPVLLVDDRPENLLVLESLLTDPELKLDKATSGNDALGLMLEHDYALVLMDVQMPEMDGYETAELMKGSARTRNIPVVFVTAVSRTEKHMFKGYKTGAVDYLFKPINPIILKSKVRVFCDLYRQKRTIADQVSLLEQRNSSLIVAREQLQLEVQKAENLTRKAMEATRSKSRFLASMSHDIRTPMNGIVGMTSLLLNTELSPEQREYTNTVQSSAGALLNLVNDILDYSKIEAGRMDLEIIDFDLRLTLEDMNEMLAVYAAEKELEIAFDMDFNVPSLLHGDPGRLRQILTNLVGNAVKFTEKGCITISVRLVNEDDQAVLIHFSVTDSGIGISSDRLDTLFDAFTQAEVSTTRKYGGTGLGLNISRQLVELMDGEIGVESEPGAGSTFWFTAEFGVQRDAEDRRIADGSEEENLDGTSVLIVDGNHSSRQILERTLEKWGCDCCSVSSGIKALKALRKNSDFDVIILDRHLSDMTGVDLADKIRQDNVISSCPLFIMLSASGHRGDVKDLKIAGFSAYLSKPVRLSRFRKALLTVVGKTDTDDKSDDVIVTRHHVAENLKKKIRLLVVEDNLVNQKVAMAILGKLGFRADIAESGEKAIEMLTNQKYDLVFMDVQMPGMDGFETTGVIRNGESSVLDHAIPIVAMTAHALQGFRKKCLVAGMNDYISKPVEPQQLESILGRFLNGQIEQTADEKQPLILDISVLSEMFGSEKDIALKAVTELIRNLPEYIDSMMMASEEGACTKLMRTARTLRDAASEIGAMRLSAAVLEVLVACRKEDNTAAAVDGVKLEAEILQNTDLESVFTE